MIESTSSAKLTFDKMSSTYPLPKPPFSAPAETHKRSEKVTTVTITFERMPVHENYYLPIKMVFRTYPSLNKREPDGEQFETIVTACFVMCGKYIAGAGFSLKSQKDEHDLDVAMKRSARRALNGRYIRPIYRAFRRWMWLAKAAHECERPKWNCNDCAVQSACDPIERGLDHEPIDIIIAREFGRVKVRVT